ncbi:MAG: ABC transporter permease subunit, partial [Rikenellaceae bacterium]|nr:ABC transporter permease subunit [Rikenellaceae bacterium]
MKRILKLAKAELQMLFYSPVAWLILVIFTFQVTMQFCNTFESLVRAQELKQGLKELSLSIFSSRDGLFNNILSYLYFYIPVLTMGLMSREFNSGSIKLLYAAPIRNSQIIFGKFLSIMVYALVMMAIIGVFVVYSCFAIHKFDIW